MEEEEEGWRRRRREGGREGGGPCDADSDITMMTRRQKVTQKRVKIEI